MYIYRYLRMLANYIVSVHLIMFALAALVDPGHCIFNCLNYKMRLIHLFHAFRSRSAVIPMPIYSMKTPSMYSGILCLIWIIIILKKILFHIQTNAIINSDCTATNEFHLINHDNLCFH